MHKEAKINRLILISYLSLLTVINVVHLLIGHLVLPLLVVTIILLIIGLLTMSLLTKSFTEKIRLNAIDIDISKLITSVDNSNELYQKMLEMVINSIEGTDRGTMMTTDGVNIKFEVCVGFDMEEIQAINLKLEETFLYRACKGKITKSKIIKDITEYNRKNISDEQHDVIMKAHDNQTTTTISSPIFVDGKLFGLLNVDSDSGVVFTNKDALRVDFFAKEISRIISLYQVFEKSQHTSRYDHLTGTVNRSYFFEKVQDLMCHDEDGNLCCIYYFDLDKLKSVNDHYGHDSGDQYIKSFVKEIKKLLRGEEIFARFGGDEFVLLLIRKKDEIELFDQILQSQVVKKIILVNGHQLELRFSYGREFCIQDDDILSIINKADCEMYKQKHQIVD